MPRSPVRVSGTASSGGSPFREFLHKMRYHFRVCLGDELVAFALELFLQLEIVFDDAVVDYDNLAGAIAVGVCVFFSGAAVSGPARVANAVGALDGRFLDDFFKVAEFSGSATDFQFSVLGDDRDARGIVSAILEFSQTLDDDRHYLFRSDVTDNSAHARVLLKTLFG